MHDVTHGHSKAPYFWVWGALIVLTLIEVYLAYIHLQPTTMLTILLGLSLIKAALIIAWFMHLKAETRIMKWMLMGSAVICLLLMTVFFPDALRIIKLGIK
jgi:cytochrome c oxidase subunit 4